MTPVQLPPVQLAPVQLAPVHNVVMAGSGIIPVEASLLPGIQYLSALSHVNIRQAMKSSMMNS